ncbi:MAG: polymer-forming cytoskeletal protein [Gammaproteobacteria bacterium]|jgi:cytoskeletal protein CcmA (bactofilin family)
MAQESATRDSAKTDRSAALPSIIASGLRVVGNVQSDGVVHIEGVVDGDIACTELTVGAAGRIDGQVEADAVQVFGRLNGTVRARSVTIAAGAVVSGEIIHETLTVEHGACTDCICRPVAALERMPLVDLRRAGRALARETAMPHRPLPPRRKRVRPLSSAEPARDETTKPLH